MKFTNLIKHLETRADPVLAVLIDPDKFNPGLIKMANELNVTCFLVGGSRLEKGNLETTIKTIKRISKKPLVLFPGDETQLSSRADGLLLPVLVSGRNPEYLVGKQVLMAPKIKKMKLPCCPMAYLLIQGKRTSATQKITGTLPMAGTKHREVCNTALASYYMGYKLLYLEAGSGAKSQVPAGLIKSVRKAVNLPLIVGGGIDSAIKAKKAVNAGANMVVVGNALEKDPGLLQSISKVF